MGVSQWYVHPRDMCIPAHISLVIRVPPVGIHKTLEGKHGGYEGQILWGYVLKFQPIQNINGRRSECNYWFEIVFRQMSSQTTALTGQGYQYYYDHRSYPNVSQNVCVPLRLWVLFWNVLLILKLHKPRQAQDTHITTITVPWYDISDHIRGYTYHRTAIAVMSVVY